MGERRRRLAMGDLPPLRAAGADDLLAECRDLLARGRVRDAFKRCQQLLALAPGLPEARYLMGRCCLAVGEKRSALAFLGAAATAEPGNALYVASLGRACSAVGQLEDAARHLAAACTLGADAEMRRDLGAVLFHLDRLQEAEEQYAEAARLAPARCDVHEALVRLRYQRDAMDSALESYRIALALDRGLAARLNIGYARCDRGGRAIKSWLSTTSESWRAVQAGPAITGSGTGDAEDALRKACAVRSLLVIDDLLDDPMAYRRRALELKYFDRTLDARVNYPGTQTAAQPCEAIMERIADALGRDIKWNSLDHGAFRLTPSSGRARCDIHVDGDGRENIYAALLYLSLPEHCQGGTGFWRHRATGWERRPSKQELASSGYATFQDFERRWVRNDTVRTFGEMRDSRAAAWDCVLHVPMRFNRLVIYRGDYFHAIADLFGDSPENTRLVQLFYFEGTASAPPH